ncbi:MAG: hypothetical protein EXR99_16570 [Gemmataceae bacterium]|nr:hypothetical protein [Gemmataceae bacterium]
MKNPLGLALALTGLALAGAVCWSADPPGLLNEVEIRAQVKLLGSDSFLSREQACEMLLRQGKRSRGALLEGVTIADLEISRRCKTLLRQIDEQEKMLRLEAFLKDLDGGKNTDLPGWSRFQKLVGKDSDARSFFAQIYKGDPAFLEESETNPALARDLLTGKCQWLHNNVFNPGGGLPQTVALTDIGAVVFSATRPAAHLPQETLYNITNLLYQPTARDAITGGKSVPFRKLVVAWMLEQNDPNIISQHLYLAQNLNLPEGLGLARKSATDKKLPLYTRAVALTLIGKMGTRDDAPTLREYVNDASLLGNFQLANQQGGSTQVRDVALAMLVQVTAQSHKDYGFSFAKANQNLHFNPYMMGFQTDTQRQDAFKKWQIWDKANPGK